MPKTADILRRLMLASGVQTKAALAAHLGLTPSNITDAVRRNMIPESWLYKVAYRTRRNIEWLKTGSGPEFLDEAAADAAGEYGRTATLRQLMEALESMDEEEQATLLRYKDLLERGDMLLRQHVINQAKLLERDLKRRGKKAKGE